MERCPNCFEMIPISIPSDRISAAWVCRSPWAWTRFSMPARLDPPRNPAEEPLLVARSRGLAEDLGVAPLELADGHALEGGDLLRDGVGVDHACSPALGPFRSGVPASGTLSLDPAESASPSTAESCACSGRFRAGGDRLGDPAGDDRRELAPALPGRHLRGARCPRPTGPLRPCMGMSFRPRCQRAGGIPLHLQAS
jgi:hypothetical protein